MNNRVEEILIQKNIGLRLRELRRTKKLTTVALASQAGISQGQLSKIENGKATISIKNLSRLGRILEIPLSSLFQPEDEARSRKNMITAVAGLENQGLHWFASQISTFTNNVVSLSPFGPFQFGTAMEQINYGLKGNLDLFVEDIVHFESMAPALGHLTLPGCFRNEEHRQAFFNTRFFRENVIDRLLENGIRLMNPNWNWMRGMERVLISPRPVISPEDVRRVKVRIYESDVLAGFWENMGAVPVYIPWSKAKQALKDKKIDVMPAMKSLVYRNGYCEHARYMTLLGDLPCALGVFISEEKYQSFSPDIQQALQKACDKAGDIFSYSVVLMEKKEEKLNLSRYKAAYLKVDKLTWQVKAFEIRKKMMEQGILSKQAWHEIEKAC